MSVVRRPRIKGVVAALPVRRKNADSKAKSPSDCKVEKSEKKLGSSPSPVSPVNTTRQAQQAPADDWCVRNDTDSSQPVIEKPAEDNIVAIIEQPSELAERTRNDDCTLNEERVGSVDGIIPLAAQARAPTLERLKNEIISESAEVLFDPIVPLPSPSKPRPKLRPAPRLPSAVLARRTSTHAAGSPLRHGSASESEEEGRRGQVVSSRIRHDSSSTMGVPPPPVPATNTPAPSHPFASPVKSAATKQRRSVTREEAARRRLNPHNGLVKRDQLTMFDLIFYNPTTNPIEHDESKKCEKVEAVEETTVTAKESEKGQINEEPAVEEERDEALPAPQLKIGADGSVVVDEKSLVIAPTWATQRKLSNTVLQESEAVRAGGRYSRQPRTAPWTDADTVRFYRALAAIGTDFSLMAPLFPDRSRRDIKTKFKKEERSNMAQVERALGSRRLFDVEALATEFARERREAELRAREQQERAKRHKQEVRERAAKLRKQGMRLSKAHRASLETLPDRRPATAPVCAADLVALSAADDRLRSASKKSRAPAAAPTSAVAPITPAAVARRVGGAVAPGSVVCLAIPDPRDPSKRVLQTYLSDPDGKLRALSVPPAALARLAQYLPGNASTASHTPAQAPS